MPSDVKLQYNNGKAYKGMSVSSVQWMGSTVTSHIAFRPVTEHRIYCMMTDHRLFASPSENRCSLYKLASWIWTSGQSILMRGHITGRQIFQGWGKSIWNQQVRSNAVGTAIALMLLFLFAASTRVWTVHENRSDWFSNFTSPGSADPMLDPIVTNSNKTTKGDAGAQRLYR